MKRNLIFAIILCSAVLGRAQPAEVILIRHGEKPDDPQALHLSPRGEERAKALVNFFTNNRETTENGAPAALFASRPTRRGNGQRPGETLAPLSKELHLPIQTPYESEHYALLAQNILKNPDLRGKTVIICWVHEHLPEFAGAFGVRPQPPKWKDEVYDRAYVITFKEGKAELRTINQKLLPGDAKYKGKEKKPKTDKAPK